MSAHEREHGRTGSIAGLDIIHLQCHIGTDTISLARCGADHAHRAHLAARLGAPRSSRDDTPDVGCGRSVKPVGSNDATHDGVDRTPSGASECRLRSGDSDLVEQVHGLLAAPYEVTRRHVGVP